MKLALKTGLVCVFVVMISFPAQGADEIHYIGFNQFVADRDEQSAREFDEYIRKLRPIMSRYGMTLETFDVVHGGSENLAADVVTIGSARDQESFQAFFADAEFQEIFPILVGALGDHKVVFTSGPFSPTGNTDNHALLSLSWLNGDPIDGIARLNELNSRNSAVFDTYGVQQMAESTGVAASHGLAGEVTPTVAPQHLELWSIHDAHGFLEDPLIKSSVEETKDLVSRSESFWLRWRDTR